MSYSDYYDDTPNFEEEWYEEVEENRSTSEIIIENSGLLREIRELKTKILSLEEQIDELNELLEYNSY